MTNFHKEQKNLQQYSRRWNLRIYQVPEQKGEIISDCLKKCCEMFTQTVRVETEECDTEVSHKTGQPSSTNSRPILVRFFDRKKRDQILGRRRNLKNKGILTGKDLTHAKYKVFRASAKYSASLNVRSSNGKVLARLQNGRILKLN